MTVARRLPSPFDWPARVAIVLAVVLASYWKIVDFETYMRLAIGRFTASHGLSGEDPFLYSLPGLRWRNPEWLGDLLLWGTYRLGGEPALVILKLALTSAGWLMLYQLARRRGGAPVVIATLAMVVLAGSEWHMSERNELHLHWLVPAYGLVLEEARRERRWLWALLPLGWLWANLHGSFTIGWVLVGAALADSLFGQERDRTHARALALVLAAHPLLPVLGPEGLAAYDLVIDHLRHGSAIKRLIREWRPPQKEAFSVAQLPLHLLGLLGLVSFLPKPNRRQVGGFLVLVIGYLFALGAQRFLLLFGLLALPVVAANLGRASALVPVRSARAAAGVLLLMGILLLAPAVKAARACPHARDQDGYPAGAAHWIAANVADGKRLFMPYTGSQWLMWLAPRVGLYIHPHFSFDSGHMIRFFEELLPRPDRFEAEVRRLGIDLALVDLVGESPALHGHLEAAPDWALIYFDGFYALFARRTPANEALIARHAYRALRARLGFEHLATAPPDAVSADVGRLEREAPLVARAVRGFQRLRAPGDEQARGEEARALLAPAMERLPSTPALIAYLTEAQLLAGDRAAALVTLERGLGAFPTSTRLKKLALQLRPAR